MVFMPQAVSKAADVTPINFRAEFRGKFSEFCGCVTDDQQRVCTAKSFSSSLIKLSTCKPVVNRSIRAMLSKMSSKRCSGLLEGTNGLRLDAFLHVRIEHSLFTQVNGATE